jgi:uncharacterized protein/tRNA (cytidine56-2'-O)-methyltransferase
MSSRLPDEKACLELLRAEGCSDKVVRHCCTVNQVAMAIARCCDADRELVNAGSWLHDIGRSSTHGILHVSEGVAIARARGLPEEVVRIISRHVAAGLTELEAHELGLPPGDYMPSSLEEKIVCHSDNLVGDSEVITLQEALDDLEARGYLVTAGRMTAMHRELSEKCGQDLDVLLEDLDVRKKAIKRCAAYVSR